jgi:hypothetical protein
MDFALVMALFAIFAVGLVFVFQGIVGGEIRPEGTPFRMPYDPEHPGMSHPPESRPWRLVLIGLALIATAIGLGLLLL